MQSNDHPHHHPLPRPTAARYRGWRIYCIPGGYAAEDAMGNTTEIVSASVQAACALVDEWHVLNDVEPEIEGEN